MIVATIYEHSDKKAPNHITENVNLKTKSHNQEYFIIENQWPAAV